MIFWIVFIAVMIITEFIRTKYISVFFAGGGIVALLVHYLGYAPFLQVLACALVSSISMAVLRKKLVAKKSLK